MNVYLLFAYFNYESAGGANDLKFSTSDYSDAYGKAKIYSEEFDNVHIYDVVKNETIYEFEKKETIQDIENKIKNLKEND